MTVYRPVTPCPQAFLITIGFHQHMAPNKLHHKLVIRKLDYTCSHFVAFLKLCHLLRLIWEYFPIKGVCSESVFPYGTGAVEGHFNVNLGPSFPYLVTGALECCGKYNFAQTHLTRKCLERVTLQQYFLDKVSLLRIKDSMIIDIYYGCILCWANYHASMLSL